MFRWPRKVEYREIRGVKVIRNKSNHYTLGCSECSFMIKLHEEDKLSIRMSTRDLMRHWKEPITLSPKHSWSRWLQYKRLVSPWKTAFSVDRYKLQVFK